MLSFEMGTRWLTDSRGAHKGQSILNLLLFCLIQKKNYKIETEVLMEFAVELI